MKAQISLEFLLTMGIGVALLVGFLWIGSYQLDTTLDEWRARSIDDAAASIQQELITAQRVQDGYSRTFALPRRLSNQDYTITMEAAGAFSVVTLRTPGTALSVRTPHCNGTLQPGTNTLRKDNNTLWCNQ
jgi:hypothetical protein